MPAPEESVTLRTFGDLILHGYKLTGFCRRCGVHKVIDLAAVRPNRVYVGATFRCKACNGAVEITLSPIATSNSDATPALDKWRER
ncbi:hypothetical protein HPDFL43_05955 [Hoeflea phototrophica DFL-43]|jgi:hypothetical protein|uniref:Uncharacterized protein n=1 Tax=Hoeflea phototrophica (strain DSM 17068 / NCIMB 14078 / DFL-43) TaxID=411684 RepID=A9D4W2_HOEPD|nr:hypothetical protein [Hoeflea phototrophica]EDQ33974.1 hypothetical protein HPDFL43_05955 [Hoeflea phototrophica DFL-43]